MTKMDLSSADNQASTAGTVTSSRITAYESTIAALSGFVGEDSLKGKAYTSAKNYASEVLIPLLKAAVLYSEGVGTGTNKIPTEYRNTGSYPTINGESPLDSALLEEELNSLDSTITSLTASLADAKPGSSGASSINDQITTATTRRDKVVKQLAELSSYDTASASFYSGLSDLDSSLATGLKQVTGAMSNFKGTFTVPKKDMDWAKSSTKKWDQRQKVLDRLEQGKAFDSEFISEVADYLGGEHTVEKDILIYDNIYGYATYKITMKLSKDGKASLSTENGKVTNVSIGEAGVDIDDGKVTKVSGGDASLDVKKGKVKGGKVGDEEFEFDRNGKLSRKEKTGVKASANSKTDYGNGVVEGSSISLALKGTEGAFTRTQTVEKDGRKTTITVEDGAKERNGNMAAYRKTTNQTEIESQLAGMDVTTELTTARETGMYVRNSYPTGYAPVTDQVREFDWGARGQEFAKNVTTGVGVVVIGSAVVAAGIFGIPALLAAVGTATAVKMGSVAATAAGAYVVSQIVDNQDRGER